MHKNASYCLNGFQVGRNATLGGKFQLEGFQDGRSAGLGGSHQLKSFLDGPNVVRQRLSSERTTSGKPPWLKVNIPSGDIVATIGEIKQFHSLNTVCEEAKCPNRHECWTSGTATFMLMGDLCTRGCRFCAVGSSSRPAPLDIFEPNNVADAVSKMSLNYVVITSVNRDDLPDGGSAHFAETVVTVRKKCPKTLIEVLIPDFQGSNLHQVVAARPEVIAHNVETVERLTPTVRDRRASYRKSLSVLKEIKAFDSSRFTKSSLMVGLGETRDDLEVTFSDLRRVDVDFLTIGQYLRPSSWHLKVEKYVHPDVFLEIKEQALAHGFKYVASGPLVRSSYKAGEFYIGQLVSARI